MPQHKWNLTLIDMGEKEYKSEKIVTYGKKSFRIVKVNDHIQVFNANSKTENPKALFDSKKSGMRFYKWLRLESRKSK